MHIQTRQVYNCNPCVFIKVRNVEKMNDCRKKVPVALINMLIRDISSNCSYALKLIKQHGIVTNYICIYAGNFQ